MAGQQLEVLNFIETNCLQVKLFTGIFFIVEEVFDEQDIFYASH